MSLTRLPVSNYVYVAQRADDTTIHKIGVTADPIRRLRELERMTGARMAYLRLIPHDDAFALENLLHHLLADYRQSGEWFALDDNMLILLMAVNPIGSLFEFAMQFLWQVERNIHVLLPDTTPAERQQMADALEEMARTIREYQG